MVLKTHVEAIFVRFMKFDYHTSFEAEGNDFEDLLKNARAYAKSFLEAHDWHDIEWIRLRVGHGEWYDYSLPGKTLPPQAQHPAKGENQEEVVGQGQQQDKAKSKAQAAAQQQGS